MDGRIGTVIMALAAAWAIAIVWVLGGRHGWASMPPLVPFFLVLLVAAPAARWWRWDILAWGSTAALVALVVLFGLSHGFLLWPVMLCLLGMLLSAPLGPTRQDQVPA